MYNDGIRMPLEPQVLEGEEKTYEIRSCIGGGGSALCYEAFEKSNDRKGILKEIYPRELAKAGKITRNTKTGALETDESLEVYYRGQDQEEAISKILRDPYGRNTPYILPVEFFHCKGTRYAIIDTSGGDMLHTLNSEKSGNGRIADLPKLKDLLSRIQRILEAIGAIHNAGYIHGDISPDNLFVSELRQDTDGQRTILCIDFNSAFLLTDKQGVYISHKDGYSPPEFYSPNDTQKICFGSDLFSVGAILFELLVGSPYNPASHGETWINRTVTRLEYFEGEAQEVKIKTWDLIRRSMVERIEADGATPAWQVFKNKIQEIIQLIDHPNHWGKTFAVGDFKTYGRRQQVEDIKTALAVKKIPVLRGIGGIGKSHLTKAYVQTYQSRYDCVLFVPYLGSLRKTILSDEAFPITNFSLKSVVETHKGASLSQDAKQELYFQEKLKKIKDLLTLRTLLILDAMDTTEDALFADFCQWPCQKIISTRNDLSTSLAVTQFNIEEIQEMDALKALFFHHCPAEDMEPEEVQLVVPLIEAVYKHTLTVILIAKSACASDIDLAELLARIQNATMNFPNGAVTYERNGQIMTKGTDIILQTVFDVLALPEEQCHILRHLCLLPSEGIRQRQFKKWMALPEENAIGTLENSGWLFKDGRTLSLHQIIADVCRKKLEPSCGQCAAFLESLTKDTTSATVQNYESYRQACARFDAIKSGLLDTDHVIFNEYELAMAWLHLSFDDFTAAERLFLSVVARNCDAKSNYFARSFLLAITVENRNQLFTEDAETQIAILEQDALLTTYKDREVAFYQNKAWYYLEKGDVDAVKYGVEICESALSKYVITQDTPLEVRRQYYQFQYIQGVAYYRFAPYAEMSIEYYAKAEAMVQIAVTNKQRDFPNRPNLAFADRNILAACQFQLGHWQQAYQTHQALLADKIPYFPANAPTMGISYRNLSLTGSNLLKSGETIDVPQLKTYVEKGIAIAKHLDWPKVLHDLEDIREQLQ